MDITLAEWFLIGTNLVTAVVLLMALRDARKVSNLFVFMMTKIAHGEIVVFPEGTGFRAVPKHRLGETK